MQNRFGTTSDMIIQAVTEKGVERHLAIDANGVYLTVARNINTQMADPNRYGGNRANSAERLKALGLDPEALFTSNKHLIKMAAAADQKKVNPLKASKRAMKK